jgi:hypothetical protein
MTFVDDDQPVRRKCLVELVFHGRLYGHRRLPSPHMAGASALKPKIGLCKSRCRVTKSAIRLLCAAIQRLGR